MANFCASLGNRKTRQLIMQFSSQQQITYTLGVKNEKIGGVDPLVLFIRLEKYAPEAAH